MFKVNGNAVYSSGVGFCQIEYISKTTELFEYYELRH